MRKVILVVLVACSSNQPSVATGELGPWQAGPALPTPRANHCTAVVGDWVLVIGGNYQTAGAFVKTDEIHAAKLEGGVLGPWQLAGTTPSPVTECNATGDGQRLYVIDGIYDDAAHGRQVWSATLDETGHLAPLTSVGALPDGTIAISSEAAVGDGTLLVMDTRLPVEGDTTVTLKTPLAAMTWSEQDWAIGFRAQAQYAFAERHIYTLGGYHDPAVGALAEVFVSDGMTVRATTALPAAVAFGEAIAVDDWVFVVGGRAGVFGVPGTTQVFAAPIADDGSLGAWTTKAPLPMPRTNHELALAGDYLVLTGGAVNGPGDATVLVAQVRFTPPD